MSWWRRDISLNRSQVASIRRGRAIVDLRYPRGSECACRTFDSVWRLACWQRYCCCRLLSRPSSRAKVTRGRRGFCARPANDITFRDAQLASGEEEIAQAQNPQPAPTVPFRGSPTLTAPAPQPPAAPPTAAPPTAVPPTPTAPQAAAPAPQPTPAPRSNFLASEIGTASSPLSSAPFMIGDAFGGIGGSDIIISGPGGTQGINGGGSLDVTGRLKLVENFSPMPRDRVFFDYNYFDDVPLVLNNDASINRYVPAFEKTFLDGWASIEMRAPVANTLNSTLSGSTPNSARPGSSATCSYRSRPCSGAPTRSLCPAAWRMSVPTGPSITLVNFPQVALNQLQIQNRAVYFQPFLSYLWTPNERFHTQSAAELRVRQRRQRGDDPVRRAAIAIHRRGEQPILHRHQRLNRLLGVP